MTRGKQQINSASSGSRLRACISVYERERAQMKADHFAPICPLKWHSKAGVCFLFLFLLFLALVLSTHGPDYSLPLETAEIKNDRWAGRDKFTLCEQHSLQTDCRVCAVWPNSTSRVSRLKAKPSAAAKQIRLEMQSSTRQQDNKTEGRQIDMREKAPVILDEMVVFLAGANTLCVRCLQGDRYMVENSVKMSKQSFISTWV